MIEKSPAKNVAFIAHSYGGVCALELVINKALSLSPQISNSLYLKASQLEDKFRERVFALAMTDSVHSMVHHEISPALRQYLCQVCTK